VMASGKSDMEGKTVFLGGLDTAIQKERVRHGGIFKIDIGLGSSVVSHRGADDNKVADLYEGLDGSAASDSYHGLYADIFKFLNGDGRGSSAHTRGNRQNLDSFIIPCHTTVLPVDADLL